MTSSDLEKMDSPTSQCFGQSSLLHWLYKDVKDNSRGWIFEGLVVVLAGISFGCGWIESIVNIDSHHWGLMFQPAVDVLNGRLPYKESFAAYGYLTNLIQAMAIALGGPHLISIGVITAIFYSVTLYLSYVILKEFLPKYAAFLAILILFLLHGYIIYPWANYYSYTFLLAALALYIKGRDSSKRWLLFLSGVAVGCSVLSRYSCIAATVFPFSVFWIYQILVELLHRRPDQQVNSWNGQVLQKKTSEARKDTPSLLSEICFWTNGCLLPLLVFALWLSYHQILDDFWLQNRIMTREWGRAIDLRNFLPRLLYFLRTAKTIFPADSRSIFFSFNFIWCLVGVLYLGIRSLRPQQVIRRNEQVVVLVGMIALAGYLNALHIYEVFRLINGAAIGLGVMFYLLLQVASRFERRSALALFAPFVMMTFVWSHSVVFAQTSSVIYAWDWSVFVASKAVPSQIPLFRGKYLPESYERFYRNVNDRLLELSKNEVFKNETLVNLTLDAFLSILSPFPKPQVASIHVPALDWNSGYLHQFLSDHQGIVLSYSAMKAQGYQVVATEKLPPNIPWITWDPTNQERRENTLYIHVSR